MFKPPASPRPTPAARVGAWVRALTRPCASPFSAVAGAPPPPQQLACLRGLRRREVLALWMWGGGNASFLEWAVEHCVVGGRLGRARRGQRRVTKPLTFPRR